MSRYILSPHKQGTDEWKADRLGKATSSKAMCMLAKGKTKGVEATTRRNYRFQVVLERITGKITDEQFSNRHTDRGHEMEPVGRMAVEVQTGEVIQEAGFAYLPDLAAGCSVDGFMESRGQVGVVEIKCPIPAIHFEYMQRDTPPAEYVAQMNHQFWITEVPFIDFASYCADMPPKLQLHIVRFFPDATAIKAHEAEVLQFLAEVDELEASLRRRAA